MLNVPVIPTSDGRFHKFYLPLLLVAYVLTRLSLIERELAFEESLWINQGRTFFQTGKFESYAGELDPNLSGFHKPPLLSLLLGLVEFIFGQGSAPVRIIPFVLGLFSFALSCVIAQRIGRSGLQAGALLICCPFLLVGFNQIQTDGTVGASGYLAVLYLVLVRPTATWSFALVGCWLALGKTEVAAYSLLAVLLTGPMLVGRSLVYRQLLPLLSGMASGVLLIGIMSKVTTGSLAGLMEIYYTIIRILLFQAHERTSGASVSLSQLVSPALRTLEFWHVPTLAAIAGITLMALLKAQSATERGRGECVALFVFSFLPLLGYVLVGWTGDGFPRYLLIAVPVMLISISLIYRTVYLRGICHLVLFSVALIQVPALHRCYSSERSQTGFYGHYGFFEVGNFLRRALPRGSAIFSPDPVGFYYGGRFYDASLVEPYPDRWRLFLDSGYRNIAAFVFLSCGGGDNKIPCSGQSFELLNKLKQEDRISKTTGYGTLGIAILKAPETGPFLGDNHPLPKEVRQNEAEHAT